MKKSIRLTITGNLQSLFFKQFIKEHAEKNNIKGFLRNLEGGKVEIFIEGDANNVDSMINICSTGPKFATIRKIEKKEERLQDFKDFKIFNF